MRAKRKAFLLCLAALLTCTGVSAQDNVSLPTETGELNQLAPWTIRNSNDTDFLADYWTSAEFRCNLRDLSGYLVVRFDYEVDAYVDGKTANREIEKLDERVVHFLKKHRWAAMNVGGPDTSIPKLKRCFRKDDVTVQIGKGTGRCSMNSPCKVYASFGIIFYLPPS
jgi:hypothetical protein